MIDNLTEILFIVNFIIFCCLCIRYEFLLLIKPRKGRVVTGVTNAFVYSIVFTVLVVYLWYIAVILWLLFGFWIISKVQNPSKKKVVTSIVIVFAVLLAIIGIANKNENKKEKNQDQAYDEEYDEQDYNDEYGDVENYDTEYAENADLVEADNYQNSNSYDESDDYDSSDDYDEDESDGIVADQYGQDGISAELTQIEEKAQELQKRLQSGSLSQSEMNQLSAELYTLWDDELNSIWARLKNTLDSDSMDRLTKEERAWIKEKEQEIKDAGSDWEGSSGQSLAENTKGTDLTRERVYELAEYLK